MRCNQLIPFALNCERLKWSPEKCGSFIQNMCLPWACGICVRLMKWLCVCANIAEIVIEFVKWIETLHRDHIMTYNTGTSHRSYKRRQYRINVHARRTKTTYTQIQFGLLIERSWHLHAMNQIELKTHCPNRNFISYSLECRFMSEKSTFHFKIRSTFCALVVFLCNFYESSLHFQFDKSEIRIREFCTRERMELSNDNDNDIHKPITKTNEMIRSLHSLKESVKPQWIKTENTQILCSTEFTWTTRATRDECEMWTWQRERERERKIEGALKQLEQSK